MSIKTSKLSTTRTMYKHDVVTDEEEEQEQILEEMSSNEEEAETLALFSASLGGDLPVVQALLAKGADSNSPSAW